MVNSHGPPDKVLGAGFFESREERHTYLHVKLDLNCSECVS